MTAGTCRNCGATLEPDLTHCPLCGEMVAPKPAKRDPHDRPKIGGRWTWIAVGVVAAGVVAGGAALAFTGNAGSSTAASVATPTTGSPTAEPTGSPSSTGPTVTAPAPPSLATTPQQAMALSSRQARMQLETNRQNDKRATADLRYSWVPQVSSKCEGLDNVDIKPSWFPNGSPDTYGLSAQQILAFHLALANRDGALMVTDRDVGDRMVLSVCAGETMWMAIIPKSFNSADAANAWCDRHGYPLGECAARWVVTPGKSGAEVKWRTA